MRNDYSLVKEIASRNGVSSNLEIANEKLKINLLWSVIDSTHSVNSRIKTLEQQGYEIGKYYIPFQEAFYSYKVCDYLNGHMLISTKRRDEGRSRPYLYYVKLK